MSDLCEGKALKGTEGNVFGRATREERAGRPSERRWKRRLFWNRRRDGAQTTREGRGPRNAVSILEIVRISDHVAGHVLSTRRRESSSKIEILWETFGALHVFTCGQIVFAAAAHRDRLQARKSMSNLSLLGKLYFCPLKTICLQ